MPSSLLFLASLLALGVLIPLALFDGLYLHLWRFRLFARPETRREHAIHTVRAVLGAVALVLVFRGDTVGPTLWLGATMLAFDTAIGVWDVVEETRARGFQGGVPRAEAAIHIIANTTHVAAAVLSLAARPLAAWTSAAPPADLVAAASVVRGATEHWLLPGAMAIAALHVLLLALPARLRGSASAPAR